MTTRQRLLRPLGRTCLALAIAAAGGSAVAQTTPDFSPPALVTPAPLVPPFNTLSVAPGNPLRGTATRSLSPALLQPIPQDGKVDLELSAKYAPDGSDIRSGLQWRVFHDETDQNGDLPLSADSNDPAPHFRLNPGGYVIHAVYGLASVSKHVVVEPAVSGRLREQLVLPAGAVKLLAVVGDKPIDADKVSFKLAVNEGGVEREVADGLRAGSRVRLPAGTYHVVSNFGDANAVVEVDVRVEPGRLVEATVHHKAALVSLQLLDDDKEELDNTSWSILTPGGDAVRESIVPAPSFVLAEGKYLAIARHDGKSFSREFAVRAGQDQAIQIQRDEASALQVPVQAAPAEGSDAEMGETGEGPLD